MLGHLEYGLLFKSCLANQHFWLKYYYNNIIIKLITPIT